MIPLRITLKGFMSYRDEATLTFDGAPLWMLAGPNGAGKSAVFDAITYALYDEHRLGAQRHAELIHKHADSMNVEFEFACGDDVYCVKRTLSRKGRASRQVLYVSGRHAPNPKKQGIQSVPETGTQKGFDRWVAETIGLSYETFTASVLLCQGKSDALLEAEPAARHKMLSQVVDLSAYQRLHDEADKGQKRFEGEASALQSQLQALAPVEERELTELAERIAAANTAMESSQRQLRHLAALKVHAGRWTALTGEQTEIQAALDATRELLARAEQIEREAKRLDELTTVVPLLDALLASRERLQKTKQAVTWYSQEAESLRPRAQEIEAVRAEHQGIVDDLRGQQTELKRVQQEAQQILLTLSPQMEQVKRMGRVREQIADIDRMLATFAVDLDKQRAALMAEAEMLTELKQVVLPWLGRFAGARARWRHAQESIQAAQQRLEEIRASLPPDVVALGMASAAAWTEHAQNEVTRAQTLLEQEQERLEHLHQVEGKPTCSYCGQELRPEHIAAEQQRIAPVIRQAEIALNQAKDSRKRATKLKKAEQKAEQDLQAAHTETQQAELGGKDALAALPEAYRVRIASSAAAAIVSGFTQNYPDERERDGLYARAHQLDDVKQRLKSVQGEIGNRDALRARRQPVAEELAELEGHYPPTMATEVCTRFQQEQARCQEAEGSLDELRQPLEEAETQLAVLVQSVQTVGEQLRTAETRLGQETVLRQERERDAAEKQDAVPAAWQPVCQSLTPEQVAAWKHEAAALSGADERYRKLTQARDAQAGREQRLAQIAADLAEIPEVARCPIERLDEQECLEEKCFAEARTVHRTAEAERQQLEVRRDQRAELTTNRKHADRQAHLYGVLARLLGRDYLQRHLLQRAEMGIVDYANRTLDRISGGTLRMALRRSETAEDQPAGKGAVKALDLVAYTQDVGNSPLLVGALSGSQRFRVAVSLALGIGEYASQGARHNQSVIIDEGFGSLDQQGRHDMIQELHALKSVLRRILVVSHQEEFFNAFSRGYKIELVDGTSRVSDLDVAAAGGLTLVLAEPVLSEMAV